MSDTSPDEFTETEETDTARERFVADVEGVQLIPPPGWVRKGDGWVKK